MVTNLVGTRIRSIRGQRKLTQQQLADLAGVPRATLATVERDDANPSLAVVFKIATALELSIDDLVESSQRRILHYPAANMRHTTSGDGVYRAVHVSPSGVFHFMQLVFRLKSKGSYVGKPHPAGSEEFIHVLKGRVDLELAGESVHLKAGDTASFQGNIRHLYSNPDEEEGWAVVTILTGRGKDNLNEVD